jgi:hypothetical protein
MEGGADLGGRGEMASLIAIVEITSWISGWLECNG